MKNDFQHLDYDGEHCTCEKQGNPNKINTKILISRHIRMKLINTKRQAKNENKKRKSASHVKGKI